MKGVKILSVFLFFLFTPGLSGSVFPQENENGKPRKLTQEYLINSWRSEKVPVGEIDNHYCTHHLHFEGICEKGYRFTETEEWKEFASKYHKGDEIWFYKSPPVTWEKKMGRQGYALFRNNKLITHITTRLN